MRAIFDLADGIGRALIEVWHGIRIWSGDAAYERYLRSRSRHDPTAPPLSREQFYLEELQKRYSRVSRCC